MPLGPKKWVNYYRENLERKPYLGDKGYFPNFSPRATYAAMISYLDEQVGEIVAKLKENGQYENTLIIFSSDNGPTHKDEQADIHFFNSTGIFVNSKNTVKGNVNEGGIRVPTIASWPKRIRSGSSSNHPCIFYDYFATVCDIIGAELDYKIDGKSYLPSLIGENQKNMTFCIGSLLLHRQQAVRINNGRVSRRNF